MVSICSGVEEGSLVSEGEEDPLWLGWDMMSGMRDRRWEWKEGRKERGGLSTDWRGKENAQ